MSMIYRSARQELMDLLTPSALSIGIAIVASFVAVGGALYTAFYRGSIFDYYSKLLTVEPTSLQGRLDLASNSVNSSNLVANASVFMTWLVIGLAVYACLSALGHVAAWSAGVTYTLKITRGTERSHVLVEVLIRFVLRLLGVLLLFSIYKLLVYAASGIVVALHYLSNSNSIKDLIIVLVGSIALTIITVYVITVSLRLITLRRRVLF